MEPQDILNETRKAISYHAGDDPDKWFYANRFVFARLQLDERKTKTHIKKQLLESTPVCYYCKKTFEFKTGIHLHRLDSNCGYSLQNCALMHGECHTQYHKENSTERSQERPSSQNIRNAEAAILEKLSQRYKDKSFLYWWDISPSFIEKIDRYDAIEFVKKDSG